MNRITVAQAAAFLQTCEDAHILLHRAPDGDCIGAGLSLQAVLRSLGKRAKVLCADPIPPRFSYLLPETPEEDFPAGCVIAVDVGAASLFGSLEETYGSRVQLCIDHHISNTFYAEQVLLEENASAACEVLYRVYREMGVPFTEQIAKCLYTGMATDTGCFKYSNTTPEAHIYTARLMQDFPAIRYDLINREMFDVKSPARIRAEIAMLSNMEYHLDGRCTIVWATLAVCRENGVDEKDMEGLTSLSLQPDGVEVGITAREREPGVFKVSLRSSDSVNVSALCAQLGGGGHIRAAGCLLRGTMDEVRRRLLDTVSEALSP